MYQITFIEFDGREKTVQAKEGQTVMSCASENLIEGILAECGGNCVCGTCRGKISAQWQRKLGPRGEGEDLILDTGEGDADAYRLTCQINMNESLDGLIIHLPESQI